LVWKKGGELEMLKLKREELNNKVLLEINQEKKEDIDEKQDIDSGIKRKI